MLRNGHQFYCVIGLFLFEILYLHQTFTNCSNNKAMNFLEQAFPDLRVI